MHNFLNEVAKVQIFWHESRELTRNNKKNREFREIRDKNN